MILVHVVSAGVSGLCGKLVDELRVHLDDSHECLFVRVVRFFADLLVRGIGEECELFAFAVARRVAEDIVFRVFLP